MLLEILAGTLGLAKGSKEKGGGRVSGFQSGIVKAKGVLVFRGVRDIVKIPETVEKGPKGFLRKYVVLFHHTNSIPMRTPRITF
jgi:hypothetical protein